MMMRRTIRLIVTLALAILAVPLPPKAQPVATMRRIGILVSGFPPAPGLYPPQQAFLHELRTLGYVEGQHLAVEWRMAERQSDELPGLAAELVRLPVDVIVALGPQAAGAAPRGTPTRPIS